MKTIALLALLAAATAAIAAPPVKKPVTSYLHLSSNSPFTTKPVVVAEQRVDTTFDDWALGGVSEVEGGYMVTLVHKKNQGETQIIKPRGSVHSAKDEMKWLNPGAPGSFKVERVEFGKTSWKDTVVFVSSGGRSGQMKFDDKLLTPTASAPPAPNRQQGQPGQQQPGQPGVILNGQLQQQQQQGGRPLRNRVQPPTPNNNAQQQQPQTQGQGRPNR